MPAPSSSRRWGILLAMALYWGVLFALTHVPGSAVPITEGRIPHLDKLVHATAFAGLAILLCAALTAYRSPTWAICAVVVALLAAYGAVDEFTQGFVPDRDPDVKDWLADVLGVAVGVGAFAVGRAVWSRARRPAAASETASS